MKVWLKEIEDRDNIFWNMNCVKYYLEKHKLTKHFLKQIKQAPVKT